MTPDPSADEANRKAPVSKARTSAKPRAGIQRKTKAEREEYARKEAERNKERDTTESSPATSRSATGRGRGGARGGRGNAIVNKTERTTSNAVSGVFGAGSGNRLERGRGAIDLGISEALDGGESSAAISNTVIEVEGSGHSKSGGQTASAARGRTAKAQVGGPDLEIIPDEDAEDQPRRDIERIWISSDDDDGDDKAVRGKGKQRRTSGTPRSGGGGLRPVRAARFSISKSDVDVAVTVMHKQNAGDEQMEDVEPEQILPEASSSTNRKDPPSSPEMSRKPLKKVESRTKDPRVSTETVEEKAERLRLQEDTESMRDVFLHKSDTDDTIDSKEEDAVFGRTDHDRIFLFQLPPLVPQLRHQIPAANQPDRMDVDQVQVKVEDAAAAAALSSSTTIPAEAPQKSGEQDSVAKDTQEPIYTADANQQQRFPEGYVGKLRIHKSGKVSLDWGGTSMEVRYGTEVDFLQDVICVEDDPSVKTEGEDSVPWGIGKAYSMGQVDRKMVLIPDWSRLYA